MTYDEIELVIFGYNDDPIPGSWRDEAIKLCQEIYEKGDMFSLALAMSEIRRAANRMKVAQLGLVVSMADDLTID